MSGPLFACLTGVALSVTEGDGEVETPAAESYNGIGYNALTARRGRKRKNGKRNHMEQKNTRLRNVGFITFFFSGICAISSGVVVSLLQEQYGFAYGMTGTLLSLCLLYTSPSPRD